MRRAMGTPELHSPVPRALGPAILCGGGGGGDQAGRGSPDQLGSLFAT